MKLGSLFSGGGLGDFGFMAAGMEIAWQCEIDEYCQKILALRYPESKKYHDIKTLKGSELEKVDIITGGFPCQPFSVAGKQQGKSDNRYLWPAMLRIIQECKPRWVIGENVPGIINMALEDVCSDLEKEGYEVWPIVFPSHALGAWHKRDRLWIVCHSKHDGQLTRKNARGIAQGSNDSKAESEQASKPTGSSEQYAPMANARCESKRAKESGFSNKSINSNSQKQQSETWDRSSNSSKIIPDCTCDPWGIFNRNSKTNGNYWSTEPTVGRVANGITSRVHRLKMLGNGQVSACTYVIGKMIMEIEHKLKSSNF